MGMKDILEKVNTIAVIGFSGDSNRPSNIIGKYLSEKGYKVYGVNPNLWRKKIDDVNIVKRISKLPEKIDLFNIFRNPEFLPEVVQEIAALPYKPHAIWTQLGVINAKAKAFAEENGIKYIEDECIYLIHRNEFK
ncbi:MAG: CoA-binding domain protein [Chlorobi bacterium OLB4]|jgi:Predicted CoA-binding protein|nr:MAG: CoA-binding domain protein [Chlorobi bacterium OLB4]OQY78901.1 MAG: hypothetical protein B6D43_00835 [Ignavibacteriales bacterium UTCHB1]